MTIKNDFCDACYDEDNGFGRCKYHNREKVVLTPATVEKCKNALLMLDRWKEFLLCMERYKRLKPKEESLRLYLIRRINFLMEGELCKKSKLRESANELENKAQIEIDKAGKLIDDVKQRIRSRKGSSTIEEQKPWDAWKCK